MKKLFFGVAVVAIALSASAFTNSIDPGDIVVNTGSGVYAPVFSFDPTNCIIDEEVCAYEILTSEQLDYPLTQTDIDDLFGEGKIRAVIDPVTGLPYEGFYDDF